MLNRSLSNRDIQPRDIQPLSKKSSVPRLVLGAMFGAVVVSSTLAMQTGAAIALPAGESTARTELEAELENLGEALEQNLRVHIDTEAIEQAARPVLRESLRTVLDVAPGVSRRAVILGEWYLGQLGDRALEELENAEKALEELEDRL